MRSPVTGAASVLAVVSADCFVGAIGARGRTTDVEPVFGLLAGGAAVAVAGIAVAASNGSIAGVVEAAIPAIANAVGKLILLGLMLDGTRYRRR